MSLATGFLLLGFGIAGESPGDVPGFHLVHWRMTLAQATEAGSYLVHTTGDTGNCFLLLQHRLTDKERTEALRSGHVSPSSPRWCHPAGPFMNTGSERNREFGLSGSPFSEQARQRRGDLYSRFSSANPFAADLATSFWLYKKLSTFLAGCVHFTEQPELHESIKAPSQFRSCEDGTKIRRFWIDVQDKTKWCIQALFDASQSHADIRNQHLPSQGCRFPAKLKSEQLRVSRW